MIKKGDKVKVKNNLVEELLKMGFDKSSAESMSIFENTEQTAFSVYKDAGEEYVTIDLCCEIPIQCCELI